MTPLCGTVRARYRTKAVLGTSARGDVDSVTTVITPNTPEAERLIGAPIPDGPSATRALEALSALGARAVLLKGGHLLDAGDVVDRLAHPGGRLELRHPRLQVNGHGTGCTLASAIAANLCRGLPLEASCRAAATDCVHGALRHAYRPGRSEVAVLDHLWALSEGERS